MINSSAEPKSPFKNLKIIKNNELFEWQPSKDTFSFEEAKVIAKQHPMSAILSNCDGSFKVILRSGDEFVEKAKVEDADNLGKAVYEIEGNWEEGIAYDLHTISSERLGQDEKGHSTYDTKRTEMGELVYKIKYQNDVRVVRKIVDLLQEVVDFSRVETIVTIPPSNDRRLYQPVEIIAAAIGKRFATKIYRDALEKTGCSQQLKEIVDPDERMVILKKTMRFTGEQSLAGKTILLLDDLYRSGSTLKVATQLLTEKAKAKKVYALTMTKTRCNR